MLNRRWFGLDSRRLWVDFLRHPASYAGPRTDWELPRGFRLRTLTAGSLLLYLRSSEVGTPDREDFLAVRPLEGEESFLIVPGPAGGLTPALRQSLERLQQEGWWPEVLMLMSDLDQVRDVRAERQTLLSALPPHCPSLVLWVFQQMPGQRRDGLDYFTLEQSLHQFGRISRRVRRRCRWRRWLP